MIPLGDEQDGTTSKFGPPVTVAPPASGSKDFIVEIPVSDSDHAVPNESIFQTDEHVTGSDAACNEATNLEQPTDSWSFGLFRLFVLWDKLNKY